MTPLGITLVIFAVGSFWLIMGILAKVVSRIINMAGYGFIKRLFKRF